MSRHPHPPPVNGKRSVQDSLGKSVTDPLQLSNSPTTNERTNARTKRTIERTNERTDEQTNDVSHQNRRSLAHSHSRTHPLTHSLTHTHSDAACSTNFPSCVRSSFVVIVGVLIFSVLPSSLLLLLLLFHVSLRIVLAVRSLVFL